MAKRIAKNTKVTAEAPVVLVEKTNIMSGQKFLEPANTPCFMSPACESYWSM